MKRSAIIFGILTALVLFFIWGQSLLPRDVSAGESSDIMRWLKPVLDPGSRVDDEVFHHLLRKAAHFTEYAALGFCMAGFLNNLAWKQEKRRLPLTVALCVAAAVIDETIQIFSDDRGPRVTDVLLDSCGAVFGIAVFLLMAFLIRKTTKHSPV